MRCGWGGFVSMFRYGWELVAMRGGLLGCVGRGVDVRRCVQICGDVWV